MRSFGNILSIVLWFGLVAAKPLVNLHGHDKRAQCVSDPIFEILESFAVTQFCSEFINFHGKTSTITVTPTAM